MWATEALKDWHDFYVLVGTAAATLLGLLFIAVSLGAGYLRKPIFDLSDSVSSFEASSCEGPFLSHSRHTW
jgi:hypothetical protein